ncbi:MAG TPA: DUF2306 domain-containing protein [Novosphingobium sp.]|nr:DUF2306 domain-containing protein [Novosphingobium sp.]
MAVGGLGFVMVHALPKFNLTFEEYTDFYWDRRYWLYVHLCAGLFALLSGPLQFVARLRQRHPGVHRWSGRFYLLGTVTAAVTAVWLAWTSPVPQPLYAIGLYLVSLLWLATGWQGWRLIRRRKLDTHREWMIRNYAVTFFFVMFFGIFDGLTAAGWPEEQWAVAVTLAVWLGILMPLVTAEWVIRSLRQVPNS